MGHASPLMAPKAQRGTVLARRPPPCPPTPTQWWPRAAVGQDWDVPRGDFTPIPLSKPSERPTQHHELPFPYLQAQWGGNHSSNPKSPTPPGTHKASLMHFPQEQSRTRAPFLQHSTSPIDSVTSLHVTNLYIRSHKYLYSMNSDNRADTSHCKGIRVWNIISKVFSNTRRPPGSLHNCSHLQAPRGLHPSPILPTKGTPHSQQL